MLARILGVVIGTVLAAQAHGGPAEDRDELAIRVLSGRPEMVMAAEAHRAPGEDRDELAIRVLSGRPEMVMAGNALVRVDVPPAVRMDDVIIRLGKTDITERFARDDTARMLTGLVDGMPLGENVLSVETAGRARGHEDLDGEGGDEGGDDGIGRRRARVVLVNHPKEGPVFSGAYQKPFYCETRSFKFPVWGTSLGDSAPPSCSADAQVHYIYKAYNPKNPNAIVFKTFPPGGPYPADLATARNMTTGETRPYIVRVEAGTANRGIYVMSFLHDPLSEPEPTYLGRSKGWNGVLIYGFGTGCNGGWYRQGVAINLVSETAPQNLLPGIDFLWANGYAQATSTLNNTSNECNDVVSAETAMAVKEHFIETYGVPDATIGFGASGGAIGQIATADNYPGILDGIVPMASFPEDLFALSGVWHDSLLLDTYFKRTSVSWSLEQKRAVTGYGQYANATAANVAPQGRNLDPTAFCPDVVPLQDRYGPQNETGVRCDIYSAFLNVFGRSPATGLVRRAVDNVGVQYGLAALNAGTITKDQFLDLNENVGGFDEDGQIVAKRTIGDEHAIEVAYATGRLVNGGLGLATIPIIDYRAYTDDLPGGDAHQRFHSFALRERLHKANGRTDNMIMLQEDFRNGLSSPIRSQLLPFAFRQMVEWIRNIKADTGDYDSPVAKVAHAKPAALQEGCMSRDANAVFVAETQVPSTTSVCGGLFPVWSYPRGVAGRDAEHGESIAEDVIKCRLKPIDLDDYEVSFTPDELTRLNAIFPDGVCDYSVPGVAQRRPLGSWIDYGTPSDDVEGLEHGEDAMRAER